MTGDAAPPRKLVAMQYGDHSWIVGLGGRSELNGRHVVLRKWQQEAQRWRCEPVGWSFERPMISVRAKNLANEPPPKAAPKAPAPSADAAVKLIKLVEREGELRGLAQLSPEARLRHLLCQRELLKVQSDILSHRNDQSLFVQASQKLHDHERDVESAQARWQAAGGLPVDIWETEE